MADIANFRGPFKLIERVHTATGAFMPLGPVLDRFKVELLANLARLMSRPNVRQLVQAIHAGGDDKAIQFVMSPIYKILNMHYVGLKATALVEGRAKPGFSKGTPTPGPGSGAAVEIAPGVRDASLVDFDEAGELIPSPAFVGLGHELIHAVHDLGIRRGHSTSANPTPYTSVPHTEHDVGQFVNDPPTWLGNWPPPPAQPAARPPAAAVPLPAAAVPLPAAAAPPVAATWPAWMYSQLPSLGGWLKK